MNAMLVLFCCSSSWDWMHQEFPWNKLFLAGASLPFCSFSWFFLFLSFSEWFSVFLFSCVRKIGPPDDLVRTHGCILDRQVRWCAMCVCWKRTTDQRSVRRCLTKSTSLWRVCEYLSLTRLISFLVVPFCLNQRSFVSQDNKTFSFSVFFCKPNAMETKARRITPTTIKRKATQIKPTLQKRTRAKSIPQNKYQWGMEQARQWASRKEQKQRPAPLTKAEQAEELKSRMARITKAKEANDTWKAVLEAYMDSLSQDQAVYKAELGYRGATEHTPTSKRTIRQTRTEMNRGN
jgi:hypothetical protein